MRTWIVSLFLAAYSVNADTRTPASATKGPEIVIKNPNSNKEPGNIRDPQVFNYHGKYYLVATAPPFWNGPNAGVKLWSSDDLANWRSEGIILSRDSIPKDAWCKDRFWAPEIFIHKNIFYLTFSARNESNKKPLSMWIAKSDKINGPYELNSTSVPMVDHGVDASLFADDDGKIYLTFAWGDIFMCEFDLDTGKPRSPIRKVIEKGNGADWDTRTGNSGIEGNALIKRNGVYYLWYSSPARGYEMGIATTNNLANPFVKSPINPVISGIGTKLSLVGHNNCFKLNDGKDAISYHGHNKGEPEGLCIDIVNYPITESRPPSLEVRPAK